MAKSREDISPDLGTCLSPTMINEVIIRSVRHNPARRSWPGAYTSTRTRYEVGNVLLVASPIIDGTRHYALKL
jgi:hypothetical protein